MQLLKPKNWTLLLKGSRFMTREKLKQWADLIHHLPKTPTYTTSLWFEQPRLCLDLWGLPLTAASVAIGPAWGAPPLPHHHPALVRVCQGLTILQKDAEPDGRWGAVQGASEATISGHSEGPSRRERGEMWGQLTLRRKFGCQERWLWNQQRNGEGTTGPQTT